MARLIYEAVAKASVKARESQEVDPKPDDLFLSKAKSLEKVMEA